MNFSLFFLGLWIGCRRLGSERLSIVEERFGLRPIQIVVVSEDCLFNNLENSPVSVL